MQGGLLETIEATHEILYATCTMLATYTRFCDGPNYMNDVRAGDY